MENKGIIHRDIKNANILLSIPNEKLQSLFTNGH